MMQSQFSTPGWDKLQCRSCKEWWVFSHFKVGKHGRRVLICLPCYAGQNHKHKQIRNERLKNDPEMFALNQKVRAAQSLKDRQIRKERLKNDPEMLARALRLRDEYNQKESVKAAALDGHLLRKFGISLLVFEQMLSDQDGRCALCLTNNGNRRLHVDHNHETGKVRGLLCLRCNTALERVENIPDWLAQAATYLNQYDPEFSEND